MWAEFCQQLQQAGELIFRDTAPNSPQDRAEGLRYIARNIPLALNFEMENCDPTHPELRHYFDPACKQGGDNGDALYQGAPIDGGLNYRISGQRGDARYLAFTVLETGQTPWGGRVIGSLFKDQLRCDEQGHFELFIGPETKAGNYIRSTPDSFRVTIRQFFADWENETPMRARIDCLDPQPPPPLLNAQTLQPKLQKAAHWLNWSTRYWAEKMDLWRAQPNRFITWGEMEKLPIDATPGGTPLICSWQLQEDEALLIRVTPPQCSYWNCEFGCYWFTTVDYRYRLAGTNCHHAMLEEDGSLIAVISERDPGVANWLDTAGHRVGYTTFRWIGSEQLPVPQCTQLKYSELSAALPAGARRITPQQRREQIAARRRGVCKRFPA